VSERPPRLTRPVGPRDHALGPPDAPVTLVEYGDFECPNCGVAHHTVRSIVRRMGDRLRLVWRQFPIGNTHPHAEAAAEASEAAAAQGRFWPMHDRLLDHQDELEDEDLVEHAAEIGLDVDHFVRDLRDHVFRRRVREDLASGARSGVNGTPTFFVNGLRHDGGHDYRALTAAIEAASPAPAE
jgi:protein-disulfide isomerase